MRKYSIRCPAALQRYAAGTRRAGANRESRRENRRDETMETTAASPTIFGRSVAGKRDKNRPSRAAFAATWWASVKLAPAMATCVRRSSFAEKFTYSIVPQRTTQAQPG